MNLSKILPALFLAITCLALPASTQEPLPSPPPDFTNFQLAGNEQDAQALNQYLWYHFHKRLGNGTVLFNKEYLTVSDLWLNAAVPRGESADIQEIHRAHLLAMQFDDEGYVLTNQHFSHAHDDGWPFPLWTQAGFNEDAVKGTAAGWHFQPLERVPGWVGDGLRGWNDQAWCGETAAGQWGLENVRSLGIIENQWQLEASGASPAILTPEGVSIDAFNAPYLQFRWSRTGTSSSHQLPYLEWQRESDDAFSPDRRVYFGFQKTSLTPEGQFHSVATMYRHPMWQGKIKRIRISLAPGESEVAFRIDSFFTHYDTRHTINNAIFILASAAYFNWTGDLDFIRQNINRMRTALRYQQTVMGGLEFNHIRVPWPGHDGRPGVVKDAAGNKIMRAGHGIGNNYWDIMPFGWDDCYATNQYYAATVKMAEIEAAIQGNPGWGIPLGALGFDSETLSKHAADVKTEANRLFWNQDAGRFAACIDQDGNRYDYGYSFLNLDAIWYDIASEEHAAAIMDWLSGERVVEGDTSTGADIYHWRFGPRATTKRNLEWYGQGWHSPESIPWGGQVQDGGAVLGFSFYDLWARLHLLGPDNAWQRLSEILAWDREVMAAGGYRAYYAEGTHGNTLQGSGTAGGLGIDAEFYESSLIPAILPYGFAGLDPRPDCLVIAPKLPAACPEITVNNLRYRNTPINLRVTADTIEITLAQAPADALVIAPRGSWRCEALPGAAGPFRIDKQGEYRFNKK